MSDVEARRHALRRFGPISAIREEYRDARGVPLVEQSLHDVRYALRLMRKHPGFTAVAIISIALGVGANALIFSIVNAVILRPLPIAQPDEVVFLEHDGRFTLSYPAYRDYRERNVTFADLAGYRISPLDLDAGRLPQRAWAYLATGNYFEMLGVRPHLGRLLTTSDDRPEAGAVAVLSYDGWTQFFARDPAIVGTVVRINRQPFTIVGVGPENFRGTEVFYQPAVWIPMAPQPVIEVGNPWRRLRRRRVFGGASRAGDRGQDRVGLTIALLTSRVLASIVYQASPADPVVVRGVIACVVMLGIAASWAPARRALRLNPTTALRAE